MVWTIKGIPWIANRGEGWVELNPAPENCVLISITEPGRQARIPQGYVDTLRLEFQDYDSTPVIVDGVVVGERKIPDGAVLFSPSLAARTANFARRHRDAGRNILIHCAEGISRSAAVAEALLEAFPEYADEGWRPRHPNGLVKLLCKRALGLVPIGA